MLLRDHGGLIAPANLIAHLQLLATPCLRDTIDADFACLDQQFGLAAGTNPANRFQEIAERNRLRIGRWRFRWQCRVVWRWQINGQRTIHAGGLGQGRVKGQQELLSASIPSASDGATGQVAAP